jgi:hypothetical protein
MVADVYGDFRDEIVLTVPTAKGGNGVAVVMGLGGDFLPLPGSA